MLEKTGNVIGNIVGFLIRGIASILNPIGKGISTALVSQIPWYVKLIIILIIISLLMPIIKLLFYGVRLVIGKLKGKHKTK